MPSMNRREIWFNIHIGAWVLFWSRLEKGKTPTETTLSFVGCTVVSFHCSCWVLSTDVLGPWAQLCLADEIAEPTHCSIISAFSDSDTMTIWKNEQLRGVRGVMEINRHKNTKTRESAYWSPEFKSREPFPELSCDRSTTHSIDSGCLCCPQEPEYTIPNRKSHLSSSAALSLWDTSGCCALLRKVGGNPCAFETISKTQIALAKR